MELGDITFILFLAVVFLLFQNSKNRKNIEKLMNPQMYSKSYSLDISVSGAVGKIIKERSDIKLLKNKENLEVYNTNGSYVSLALLPADNVWLAKSRNHTSFIEYQFSDIKPIYSTTLLYFNEKSKTKKLDYLHELNLEIYQRINERTEGMPAPEPYLSICLVERNNIIDDCKVNILVSADWPINNYLDLTSLGWNDLDDGSYGLFCEDCETIFGTKEHFFPMRNYEKNGIRVSFYKK